MPCQRHSGHTGAPRLTAAGKAPPIEGAPFVIHGLSQARAVLAAALGHGAPVVLLSATAAAGYAGPGWFRALLVEAREAHPGARCLAILDCGELPGRALAAIRAGVEAISLRGPAETVAKVAAIAERSGCRLVHAREIAALGPAVDLGRVDDPPAAAMARLAATTFAGGASDQLKRRQ